LVEFLDRGCLTLVATHYPELKAFAHLTDGVENASVEFDLESLQPTYHLTVGLPGRSNALAIAERLGLRKRIVEAARAELSPDDLRADSLLEEIRRQRDAAVQAGAEAERASLEARSLRDELRRRLDNIVEERTVILEQARREAGAELEAARRQLAELRRRLTAAGEPLQSLGDINEELGQVEAALEAPNLQPLSELVDPESDWHELAVGDRVLVRSIAAEGILTALGGGQAEVRLGRLRIKAEPEDLVPLPSEPASEQAESEGRLPARSAPPPLELHVRGRTVEEALEQLERSLDAAYLAGMPYLRVVHGKGTGRLRQAIRQALTDSSYVASFNSGTPAEGGEGVTVVWMAQD
jgi:DNA mismatch repair protein MutS2